MECGIRGSGVDYRGNEFSLLKNEPARGKNDTWRIEARETPVALLVRYRSGRWGVFDEVGCCELFVGSFNTPTEAFLAYRNYTLTASEITA